MKEKRIRNLFINSIAVFVFILMTCTLYTSPLYAQRENVWAFGTNAGLDFNSGSPVPIQTAANEYESSASVCDKNGQLLFYTDGDTVYSNNEQIMANGSGLTGQPLFSGFSSINSTTQGALIVPMPDSADKYYVFSLSSSSGGALHPGWLYYSVVDMSLNNGLGEVDANRKGILLDTNLTENMTGVEGNQCDVWLLVRSRAGFQFKTYDITSSGISTSPVISGIYLNTGIPEIDTDVFAGGVTVSPNRKKLGSVLIYGSSANSIGYETLELDDFDATTGMVSNRIVLDSDDAFIYKCAFSPNNSKLYISGAVVLFQYDLSLSDPAAIIASQFYVGASNFSDIKLAPDGKVYFFTGDANLGAIESPNLVGVDCQYNNNAVALLPNTSGGPALPNAVAVINVLTVNADSIRTACFTDSTILQIADTAITDFTWDNGSNNVQRTVYAPGTYVATYHTPPCTYHTDTFTVTFINPIAATDTTVCSKPPLLLYAPVTNASYLWQDGSTGNTYNAATSGIYTVQINEDGCQTTDSLGVTFVNLQQNLGNDTIFCKEDKVKWLLNANVPLGATAMWSNGSTDSSITINDSGTYWVTVSDAACVGSDSVNSDTVRIGELVCNCIVVMPNAFTPNGDGKDDIMRPIVEPGCVITYILRIYNRWGVLISATTNESQGWDGTLNGTLANIGTYMYTLEYQAGLSRKRQYLKGDITLIR